MQLAELPNRREVKGKPVAMKTLKSETARMKLAKLLYECACTAEKEIGGYLSPQWKEQPPKHKKVYAMTAEQFLAAVAAEKK